MSTTAPATNNSAPTPTATALEQALQDLQPQNLILINESAGHSGYFEGKESHFKLTIVSDDFTVKRLVGRHQLVYQLVDKLLTSQGGNIHALAIHAYTPDEWQVQGGSPDSPSCAGQNVN
jgi:BolA protein